MAHEITKEHNDFIVRNYFNFEERDEKGRVYCKCCENYLKDNSGHTNLISHVKQKHIAHLAEKLKEAEEVQAQTGIGKFVTVTKIVSPEAKNMFGWIEWIVMCDLPLTVTENEQYRNKSKLQPTSYKTVSSYMEKLLGIVRENIKRGLPKTFGLLFDGWSCDGEHYVGIFATWSREDGSVIRRLIACGVQDLPETAEAAQSFGFAADDIGDYLYDVLELYNRQYTAIEFLTGDKTFVSLQRIHNS